VDLLSIVEVAVTSSSESGASNPGTPGSSRRNSTAGNSAGRSGTRAMKTKKRKFCYRGMKCGDAKCKKSHPRNWDPCPVGKDCPRRYSDCPHKTHPGKLTYSCDAECDDFECAKSHPKARRQKCFAGLNCCNASCSRLHPLEWSVCPDGANCTALVDCPFSAHPKKSSDDGHSLDGKERRRVVSSINGKLLRSSQERDIQRANAGLPIFGARGVMREQFVRRLRGERILVVTAETGSGKVSLFIVAYVS
jgi:hypothetical protein